jgi:hypothetical protein
MIDILLVINKSGIGKRKRKLIEFFKDVFGDKVDDSL